VPVTVIIGGQFGSEGKGKVAHHFAKQKRATVAIRVGGSNSGHTVIDKSGAARVFRVLPTAAILENVICVLGAGSYIDIDLLLEEAALAGLRSDRLLIDPNAYVVSAEHKNLEREWKLGQRIGSTLSGTGAAVIDRIRRRSDNYLAVKDKRLSEFVSDEPVRSFLRRRLQRGENVIVEGTQGFGLSLLHSPFYPKVTSRDTTASGFIAEAGLSPLDVDDVVMVLRAFPIRVAGDSGPLANEIDWNTITNEGGWETPLVERTSVTKQVRRVARFDPTVVLAAIETNLPTQIVLNHVDYFDAQGSALGKITANIVESVQRIEREMNAKVDLVGLDPSSLVRFENASFKSRLRSA
jgi:adenylosuccinate synthase